jgi:uncharacterized UPF0146 family protein
MSNLRIAQRYRRRTPTVGHGRVTGVGAVELERNRNDVGLTVLSSTRIAATHRYVRDAIFDQASAVYAATASSAAVV